MSLGTQMMFVGIVLLFCGNKRGSEIVAATFMLIGILLAHAELWRMTRKSK